jgi:leader peptidase (prepilin peptidase) / N-methyltransferase
MAAVSAAGGWLLPLVGAIMGAWLFFMAQRISKDGTFWTSSIKPQFTLPASQRRWLAAAAIAGAFIAGLANQIAAGSWHLALLLAAGWLLLFISFIDACAQILPRLLNFVIAILGLIETTGLSATRPITLDSTALLTPVLEPANLAARLVGAFIALVALMLIKIFYARLRRREGLGLGDVFLFAALACWVGWQALPWLMCLAAMAALIGILSGAILSDNPSDQTTQQRFAFGPWLAAAGWTIIILQRLG